jgi:hypothetical protein
MIVNDSLQLELGTGEIVVDFLFPELPLFKRVFLHFVALLNHLKMRLVFFLDCLHPLFVPSSLQNRLVEARHKQLLGLTDCRADAADYVV